jgi:urea transport system ATP-binding protein
MMRTAIDVAHLHVQFGAFRAITDLSLTIGYGEVHAIIGPNGAGKTTLLDVISGLTRPRSGTVVLDGTQDLAHQTDTAIARAGVRRKFQKPSVFMALTVAENLDIGAGAARSPARIAELAELIGLSDRLPRLAGTLAHGQKQWLEIGMVLAASPRVLMLDEPVAGLTDAETERTADLVRRLRAPDRAIVVVEHDMDFVERIADRVTVLHEGRTLFEGTMADARRDQRVIDVYLGR